MAVKKAYKVVPEKKWIVLDDEVEMSKQDLSDVKFYVSCGYELKHKSKAKSEKAKKTAKDTAKYTKEFILKDLKGDDLAEFNAILDGKGKGHGWFAAKSWYIKNHVNKKEEK